jgi:bifunctional DNA-binding transcriptional regulator/antitoxin component of YhaV-PrlF toxin-antitoxin module
MTITVKNKTPLVVPPAVRRQAGLRSGDELEFRVSGRVITICPKVPQATGDDYTPEQRRVVDRGIAKGLEDIRNGRTHGPFTTADAAIAHLQSLARSRKKAARKSSQ